MNEKNETIKIQIASAEDAEELLAIYAPYVEKTAITFEYDVPSVEEFKGRITHVLERFPYLKAVENGKILGYAYVSPFKERAAFTRMTDSWRDCAVFWIYSCCVWKSSRSYRAERISPRSQPMRSAMDS